MEAGRMLKGAADGRSVLLLALVTSATALALVSVPSTLSAQPPAVATGVGIKVTVTDVRPQLLEADMDLTWYTRVGPYPSTTAGYPYIGYPALDYGDGDTVSYTTLVLASAGGGPGGSNVYRNLASFTHTYPTYDDYTVTGASICTLCGRYQVSVFPTASPSTPTFASSISYTPQTVVGNLVAPVYSRYTFPIGDGYSVRFITDVYLAVTNTARVHMLPDDIPTASPWGLVTLGGLLALTGLVLLRRL